MKPKRDNPRRETADVPSEPACARALFGPALLAFLEERRVGLERLKARQNDYAARIERACGVRLKSRFLDACLDSKLQALRELLRGVEAERAATGVPLKTVEALRLLGALRCQDVALLDAGDDVDYSRVAIIAPVARCDVGVADLDGTLRELTPERRLDVGPPVAPDALFGDARHAATVRIPMGDWSTWASWTGAVRRASGCSLGVVPVSTALHARLAEGHTRPALVSVSLPGERGFRGPSATLGAAVDTDRRAYGVPLVCETGDAVDDAKLRALDGRVFDLNEMSRRPGEPPPVQPHAHELPRAALVRASSKRATSAHATLTGAAFLSLRDAWEEAVRLSFDEASRPIGAGVRPVPAPFYADQPADAHHALGFGEVDDSTRALSSHLYATIRTPGEDEDEDEDETMPLDLQTTHLLLRAAGLMDGALPASPWTAAPLAALPSHHHTGAADAPSFVARLDPLRHDCFGGEGGACDARDFALLAVSDAREPPELEKTRGAPLGEALDALAMQRYGVPRTELPALASSFGTGVLRAWAKIRRERGRVEAIEARIVGEGGVRRRAELARLNARGVRDPEATYAARLERAVLRVARLRPDGGV